MGGNNGLFFMDELFTQGLDTLSENDIGDPREEETGDPAGQLPDKGETAGGIEQNPGDDKEDQGKTDQEDLSGSDTVNQEQKDVIIYDSELQLRFDEIKESLERLDMQEDTDLKTLTDSIRSFVDVMSVDLYSTPGYVYEPPEIPIEGYQEWDYPIIVDYLITIVGYGEPVPQSNDYDDPDQFLEDFQAFAFECYKGDVYSEFIIDKVWGADGKKIYDSQGMEEPEPDPVEEEPSETLELLLSHLESIDTTLAEMQQADLEYYQAVYDYHSEMLELQAYETAGTIFIVVGVVFILAELLWSELFRRFK